MCNLSTKTLYQWDTLSFYLFACRFFTSAIITLFLNTNDVTRAQAPTSNNTINCVKEMTFYKIDETKLPFEGMVSSIWWSLFQARYESFILSDIINNFHSWKTFMQNNFMFPSRAHQRLCMHEKLLFGEITQHKPGSYNNRQAEYSLQQKRLETYAWTCETYPFLWYRAAFSKIWWNKIRTKLIFSLPSSLKINRRIKSELFQSTIRRNWYDQSL